MSNCRGRLRVCGSDGNRYARSHRHCPLDSITVGRGHTSRPRLRSGLRWVTLWRVPRVAGAICGGQLNGGSPIGDDAAAHGLVRTVMLLLSLTVPVWREVARHRHGPIVVALGDHAALRRGAGRAGMTVLGVPEGVRRGLLISAGRRRILLGSRRRSQRLRSVRIVHQCRTRPAAMESLRCIPSSRRSGRRAPDISSWMWRRAIASAGLLLSVLSLGRRHLVSSRSRALPRIRVHAIVHRACPWGVRLFHILARRHSRRRLSLHLWRSRHARGHGLGPTLLVHLGRHRGGSHRL